MTRLALLGAGGHGKVVAEMALLSGWDEVAFFDDSKPRHAATGPWEVEGSGSDLLTALSSFDGVVVSIGDGRARLDRQLRLAEAGARIVTLIHPAATVSRHAFLDAGTVVMAGAVVNIDTRIGLAGIINTGATVDHDCRLGDAVHVCPGAHLSGHVQIGNFSWIGVGAAVRQGIQIGHQVMVGAGGVVVGDIGDDLTVTGNPARARPAPHR